MVSKSGVWQQIADDLNLSRKNRGKKTLSTARKVGHEIALETQAVLDGDPVAAEVECRETHRLLDKAIRDAKTEQQRESLESIREKYDAGEMADGQVRQTIELYEEQNQDARSQRASGKP